MLNNKLLLLLVFFIFNVFFTQFISKYYIYHSMNENQNRKCLDLNDFEKMMEKLKPEKDRSIIKLKNKEDFFFKVNSKRGFWVGGSSAKNHHAYDKNFAQGLGKFFKFEKILTIIDLGGGMGNYTQYLRNEKFFTTCVDGNPNSQELSDGRCSTVDLSKPVHFSRHDWVISIEVGEHLPKNFEKVFFQNLDNSNKLGAVLSWAVEGQFGSGHFNERNNSYVIQKMRQIGYKFDGNSGKLLRKSAKFDYLKNTIMECVSKLLKQKSRSKFLQNGYNIYGQQLKDPFTRAADKRILQTLLLKNSIYQDIFLFAISKWEMYDVTDFVRRHPGGKIIDFYTFLDEGSKREDSTHAMDQFHNRSNGKVQNILKTLRKRPASPEDLKKFSAKDSELSKDFESLFTQLKAEGLFEPSYIHVTFRILELIIYLILSITFGRYSLYLLSSISLACLRFRSGYLMHEGGHRSLTGHPKIDNFIQEITAGAGVGFSSSWWNSQHNRHHAMPQRLERDVDLDTVPLLAFNSKVTEVISKNTIGGFNLGCNNLLIKNQRYLFLFLDTIIVGAVFTLWRSPAYAWHKGKNLELFCMFFMTFILPVLVGSWTTWAVGGYLASLILFGNFSLNHTHLPVTSEMTHWVEYSLLHTANINSSRFLNWWMGHLEYQIEHHLFPTLPSFRSPQVAPRVRQLALKHGIEYQSLDYFEAAKKVFDNLGQVSKEIELLDETTKFK